MPSALWIVVACGAALAGRGAHPVPLAGQYVYKVSRPDTIQGVDTPEDALRNAARILWNTDQNLATVLAENRIPDPSKLVFGDLLRIPPPRDAREQQANFVLGLRLVVILRGQGTLRVDCDPCQTPRTHTEDPQHGLMLKIADDFGQVLRVPLVASEEAGSDARRFDGEVQDLRAWDLPGGDVLLAVKTQSESGGAHWGADGRVAFFRLGPGPEAELLQAVAGDGGVSAGNGGSREQVTLSAALEGGRFVVTVERTQSYVVAEGDGDGRVQTRTGDSVSRQRIVYDASTRAMTVEPPQEVSAFTEDAPRL